MSIKINPAEEVKVEETVTPAIEEVKEKALTPEVAEDVSTEKAVVSE